MGSSRRGGNGGFDHLCAFRSRTRLGSGGPVHQWAFRSSTMPRGGTDDLFTSDQRETLDDMVTKRKTARRRREPGDCHELTFSCYRQIPLLTNDAWRRLLSESVDRAMRRYDFDLIAFVFMPEHVHLLVLPATPEPRIDLLLKAIKRPFSFRIKQDLIEARSRLLDKLNIRERPGIEVFRFWQEGGGYDRNLTSRAAILAAIDYIHLNPVRRGLCERVVQWKWSSARFYHESDGLTNPELPTISRPLPEFFDQA
jgi:REP-associated tyrosine transposase